MIALVRPLHGRPLSASLDVGATATTIAATMSGMMVLGKANFSKAALKKTVNQVVGRLD